MTTDESMVELSGSSMLLISAARNLDARERHEAQQRYQEMKRIRAKGQETLVWHRRRGPHNSPVATNALYHRVKKDEGYDTSIVMVHELLAECLTRFPESRLVMYLDVDEHRDSQGWLDDDMTDLLCNVHVDMSQWLSEIYSPLAVMEINVDVCRHPFPRLDGKPVTCEHTMVGDEREALWEWFKVQSRIYHEDR